MACVVACIRVLIVIMRVIEVIDIMAVGGGCAVRHGIIVGAGVAVRETFQNCRRQRFVGRGGG